MVERHIWALGKNLDQWEGPPEEAEGEDEEDKEKTEEDKEDKEDTEDKEEIEEEGRVKLNCQTQASKYTK